MADGIGYGSFSGAPYPFWLSSPSPSPHPSASAPPFLATHPVNLTQGGFDPTISQGSYHRSPSDWSNNPSYGGPCLSQTPSSSFYVNKGSFSHRGEDDSYTYMLPPPSGLYPSKETSSSSDFLLETQRLDRMPYKFSATLSSSSEPFYKHIPPSGVYGSAFHENLPGQYHPGHDKFESMNAVSGPPAEPWVLPQALFDGSHTGVRLGDGRLFPDVVSCHAPENVQSSVPGSSSVEPVNFNVLLGYAESTGHVKPLSQNPDLHDETGQTSPHPLQFDSKSSEKREGSGVSSLYQTPKTFVADSENGVSETSLKNAIDDLNCDEHRSWNHFMVSSEGPSAPTMFSMGSESYVAMKADNGNAAQSAVNCKTPSDGCANQHSEDVQACKLQKQMFDMNHMMNGDKKPTALNDMGIKGSSKLNTDGVSTGQLAERHLCDQGSLTSTASSPRVTSVVDAMHNLSEVLVYECFNNGSWLKQEQLSNLDKAVENLTKCLKKSTGNKTIAAEASIPTQAIHVSCPNVVDLNEATNVVAKDCQGFNVKPLDSFGLKEPVDKDKYEDEMTQGIKNILASNFPDGEDNHPQTLLYKSLWLETEAALCSTTCMTRYHRIKKEIGNLKLQNRENSAHASTTFMQEPFLDLQKPVSIMNNVEQESTDSFIKHGSNSGKDIVTMSHDAPQSTRFNSDHRVNAVLSLMSRSFMGGLEQEHHGNFKHDAATSGKIPDATQQESPGFTTEEKHRDVTDRFQILKQQETKHKLKSQNCSKTRIDDQEENPEANSEVANIGRSSQMSDVMDRFKILRRREAEQVQKSLNSLDADSDSDKDKPSNKTQICDHPWSESMMTVGGNSVKETCANSTEEPSASGEGYESPTSDWEHVRKDN
ncbi:hypothetical protein Bca4012_026029 [Brassica carinata]|uniref:Uncharacterized protein n=1 Tax=Brassica carinata TaxID=52824 RepID=A0A8X7VHU9_BRACI|nr:hypothetical protein Bca52824_023118 [Brassica carinata]